MRLKPPTAMPLPTTSTKELNTLTDLGQNCTIMHSAMRLKSTIHMGSYIPDSNLIMAMKITSVSRELMITILRSSTTFRKHTELDRSTWIPAIMKAKAIIVATQSLTKLTNTIPILWTRETVLSTTWSSKPMLKNMITGLPPSNHPSMIKPWLLS